MIYIIINTNVLFYMFLFNAYNRIPYGKLIIGAYAFFL